MRIDMAENHSYDPFRFSVGSTVACTTCYNQKVQGEVLAFDYNTKMLAIKAPAASGKHNLSDVKLVNLNFVSDVEVIAETDSPPAPLASLNLTKINNRVRQNLDEKRRQLNYIGIDVSPEGQRVFNAILKTISDIKWEGKTIVVMNEVRIVPPYSLSDCKGKEGDLINHVRKIVKRHLETEAHKQSDIRKSLSPSPASTHSGSSS